VRKALAYCMSLVVLASAVWMPTTAYAQVVEGSPFGGGGSGGGVSWPVSDAVFQLSDDATPTKTLQFQLAGLTGGTNAVLSVPNFASGVMALTNQQQTFTANTTWTACSGIFFGTTLLYENAAQTPDTAYLGVGATSRHLLVAEFGDLASDFAVPQQTNPGIAIAPATVSTTQRTINAYHGQHGRAIKALTESAATSAVQIPVAAGAGVGGTITFTVFASDATDHQTLTGVLQYAAVNKAATETCATPTLTGTALNSVSTGTLTCTYACDTTPANAVNVQFNCVSSLTQTTLDLYWRLNALGASEPLPQ
jgi:hypothetical protein